jgi:hypothetical protein
LLLSNSRRPLSPIAAEPYSPAVFLWYIASLLSVGWNNGGRAAQHRNAESFSNASREGRMFVLDVLEAAGDAHHQGLLWDQ